MQVTEKDELLQVKEKELALAWQTLQSIKAPLQQALQELDSLRQDDEKRLAEISQQLGLVRPLIFTCKEYGVSYFFNESTKVQNPRR